MNIKISKISFLHILKEKMMSKLGIYLPFLKYPTYLVEYTVDNSKTIKIFALSLLVSVYGAFAQTQVAPVTEAMWQRALVSKGDPARLYAVLAKARRGEPICVAAIGGSITAGGQHTKDPKRRYVQQLTKWFEDTFPGLKVTFVNAGIGATSSNYGAVRVKNDVIDKKPDLVVVEYAVNDDVPAPVLGDSYEGVLRQLLSSSKNLAVIELFFMHKDGKSARVVQEQLGKYYGLPMISFREAMWTEFQSGQLKWEDFYADVVHPSNEGHDITSELLRRFMTATLANLPTDNKKLPKILDIPKPLFTNVYDNCVLFRGEEIKITTSTGWVLNKPKWECTPVGGTIDYEIPGQILHMGLFAPPAAKNSIEISIDGAPFVPVLTTINYRPVATGLTSGIHKVKLMVRPYQATPNAPKDNVQVWWVGAAGIEPQKK
jgi:lysophospholipase L1-like esterase